VDELSTHEVDAVLVSTSIISFESVISKLHAALGLESQTCS
jgi:hypothetical protein